MLGGRIHRNKWLIGWLELLTWAWTVIMKVLEVPL